MPAIIVAAAITAGASVGTSVYMNRQQRKANDKAAAQQGEQFDEQMVLERQRMDDERKMWEAEQADLRAFHEAQQKQAEEDIRESRFRWETGEANAEPYREAGYAATNALLERAGLPAAAPRVKPTPPAHFADPAPAPTTPVAPGARTGGGDRNTTSMWDDTTLPTTRSETPAMSPESYARIASSPEALAQMTPEERVEFSRELQTIPMGTLMARPRRTNASTL
jgi:Ni/Co efflux regulator RcnB